MESGDAVGTRSVVGPVETDFFSFLFFLFFISTPGLNRASDLILCNCCPAPSWSNKTQNQTTKIN